MKLRLFAMLSLVISINANAEPRVISDTGKTYPIAPYFENFDTGEQISSPIAQPSLLPISTPELTVGKVQKRKVSIPYMAAPLFVIGSDRQSLQWLQANKATLAKMGAVGMVVSVQTEAELKAIIAISSGLQIVPVSGSQFARQFGLKHYPALITRQYVTQ